MMFGRILRKQTLIIALTLSVIVGTSINATCSRADVLTNSQDVISSMRAAQPIIKTLPGETAQKFSVDLDKALQVGQRFHDAYAAATTDAERAQTIPVLSELIQAFEVLIQEDASLIKDANLRTQVMSALALADIGLSFISNHVKHGPPVARSAAREMLPSGASDLSAIDSFAAKEVWGRKYKN